MTGHSLGCYLAQIAVVEAYQKYPDFYNHVLRKVTTFSAPKVRLLPELFGMLRMVSGMLVWKVVN